MTSKAELGKRVLAERSSGETKVAPRGFAEYGIESLTVARGVEERAKLSPKGNSSLYPEAPINH